MPRWRARRYRWAMAQPSSRPSRSISSSRQSPRSRQRRLRARACSAPIATPGSCCSPAGPSLRRRSSGYSAATWDSGDGLDRRTQACRQEEGPSGRHLAGPAVAIGAALVASSSRPATRTRLQSRPTTQAPSKPPTKTPSRTPAPVRSGQSRPASSRNAAGRHGRRRFVRWRLGNLLRRDACFSAALPPVRRTIRTSPTSARTRRPISPPRRPKRAAPTTTSRRPAAAHPPSVGSMINWEYTAKAGDIVSLFGTSYEFTGGAHGMTLRHPHRAHKRRAAELRQPCWQRGLSPAIVIAMCEALKKVKLERIGRRHDLRRADRLRRPERQREDRGSEDRALAPSDQAGKFGGIYVYYRTLRSRLLRRRVLRRRRSSRRSSRRT